MCPMITPEPRAEVLIGGLVRHTDPAAQVHTEGFRDTETLGEDLGVGVPADADVRDREGVHQGYCGGQGQQGGLFCLRPVSQSVSLA